MIDVSRKHEILDRQPTILARVTSTFKNELFDVLGNVPALGLFVQERVY
jgi:hypothetical protein